jgi:septum formation protein
VVGRFGRLGFAAISPLALRGALSYPSRREAAFHLPPVHVTKRTLILASRSPRRRELLAADGYRFQVVPPHPSVECGVCSRESPAELVARLAFEKAADVARRVDQGLVLGCDTVAEIDGQVLGKPDSEALARRMLATLRGREHRVLSGLCLWEVPGGTPIVRVDATRLRMDPLTDAQLDEYVRSYAWEGKAGAFGYQDGLDWVHILEGSESNVVGLPMELLARMLQDLDARPLAGDGPAGSA